MNTKKIGLALSGGGARGFAHLGVIKALTDNGIPIDMIAGTSAGSVIGGCFAAGMTVEEMIAMGAGIGWTAMTRPSLSPLGMLTNRPMGRFLDRHLPVTRFEDLKLRFAAVAYDLERNEEVVLHGSGSLTTAIMASCAIPGIFIPVRDAEGRDLVDGGLSSPLPVDAVKMLGADLIIAVDLLSCEPVPGRSSRTAVGMMLRSTMALLRAAARNQVNTPDVTIVPRVGHIRPEEIRKRSEIFDIGVRSATASLNEIRAAIARINAV